MTLGRTSAWHPSPTSPPCCSHSASDSLPRTIWQVPIHNLQKNRVVGRATAWGPRRQADLFLCGVKEHKHLHAKRLENLWSGIHGEHEESSEVKCAGHPRSLSETQHSLLGNGTAAFLSNQVPSAIANQITNLSHGPGGCVDVVLPARSASPEGRHASSSSPCLGFGFWIPLPWPCSARPEREKRLIHW